jgi:hypothetical protein
MRHIFMETRAVVDTENATNSSRDRTHRAPDDCTYGARVSVAYGGALFCTLDGALRCAATGSAIVASNIIAHSLPDLIDRPSVEYFELILGNLPRPSSFLLMKF